MHSLHWLIWEDRSWCQLGGLQKKCSLMWTILIHWKFFVSRVTPENSQYFLSSITNLSSALTFNSPLSYYNLLELLLLKGIHAYLACLECTTCLSTTEYKFHEAVACLVLIFKNSVCLKWVHDKHMRNDCLNMAISSRSRVSQWHWLLHFPLPSVCVPSVNVSFILLS